MANPKTKTERLSRMRQEIKTWQRLSGSLEIDPDFLGFVCDQEYTPYILKIHNKYIIEADRWIQKIVNGPFNAWLSVRGLLSEGQWLQYELMGDMGDLRECKMLAQAAKDFRKAIYKKRPSLLNKKWLDHERKSQNKSS